MLTVVTIHGLKNYFLFTKDKIMLIKRGKYWGEELVKGESTF